MMVARYSLIVQRVPPFPLNAYTLNAFLFSNFYFLIPDSSSALGSWPSTLNSKSKIQHSKFFNVNATLSGFRRYGKTRLLQTCYSCGVKEF